MKINELEPVGILPLVPLNCSGHKASLDLRMGSYRVRYASDECDRRAAFRLRFEVFNLELNEGLENAYQTGLLQLRHLENELRSLVANGDLLSMLEALAQTRLNEPPGSENRGTQGRNLDLS